MGSFCVTAIVTSTRVLFYSFTLLFLCCSGQAFPWPIPRGVLVALLFFIFLSTGISSLASFFSLCHRLNGRFSPHSLLVSLSISPSHHFAPSPSHHLTCHTTRKERARVRKEEQATSSRSWSRVTIAYLATCSLGYLLCGSVVFSPCLLVQSSPAAKASESIVLVLQATRVTIQPHGESGRSLGYRVFFHLLDHWSA